MASFESKNSCKLSNFSCRIIWWEQSLWIATTKKITQEKTENLTWENNVLGIFNIFRGLHEFFEGHSLALVKKYKILLNPLKGDEIMKNGIIKKYIRTRT